MVNWCGRVSRLDKAKEYFEKAKAAGQRSLLRLHLFFFSLRDNRTWERAAVQYDYVGSRTVERVEDGEVRNAAGLSPGDAGPRRGKFTWFISSLLGGYVYMIAAHDGGDVQGAGRRIPAGSGWTRHAEAAARDAGKKRPHRRGNLCLRARACACVRMVAAAIHFK
jgi:hypothetical protein